MINDLDFICLPYLMMNESEAHNSCQRVFKFSFPFLTDSSKSYDLEVPVEIPYSSDPLELCSRIIDTFFIPAYIEEDLEKALVDFIQSETTKFFDQPGSTVVRRFQNGELDVDSLIDKWDRAYTENTVEFGGDQFGSDDAELFSTVYHKLVHSSALETILQVEHSYAEVVRKVIKRRDKGLQILEYEQTKEMENALSGVGTCLSENEITEIAGRHVEQRGMEVASYASELDSAQEVQKREYRDWLMGLVERNCDSPIVSPVKSVAPIGGPSSYTGVGNLEESFTIHLGSQLKHMYNIRILSADPLDLTALRTTSSGELEGEQPQRLQTSLSLYSSDLCGLVLLTDSFIGSFSGMTKDFISVCEMSTELHFNSIEKQLNEVRNSVKEAIETRKLLAVNPENHTLTSSEIQARRSSTKYLQTGDVYITKHSNLSEVHVVYHMVVDDTIRSNDMNSRHPAILGLRNIMKCACSNDVTSLTIPVLLTHELTPEMTVVWCAKRAELVYKCVKGFMIEMASWGGAELKNLQFMLPKDTSEEIFNTLATMLPSIFKVSNPLVLSDDNPAAKPPVAQTKRAKKNK